MKLAICISGFVRTFAHAKESLLKLIRESGCDVDVFIYTYYQNHQHFTCEMSDTVLTEKELGHLFEGLNVKGIKMMDKTQVYPIVVKMTDEAYEKNVNLNKDNYGAFHEHKKGEKTRLAYGLMDQLWCIKECNKMRQEWEEKHGFKYDLVMKTRFDVLYLSTPDFTKMKRGVIYAGLGGFKREIVHRYFPDEIVGIGDSDSMTLYSNRIDQVMEGRAKMCAHESLVYILALPRLVYEPFRFDYCVLRDVDKIHYLGKVAKIEEFGISDKVKLLLQ